MFSGQTQSNMLTLTTDFGLQDVYVGVMKGVIAGINPHLNIIDLTHQIPPQNITAGRFALMNAFPYFPHGTVHVAVVDPGVGSQRRGIAIALPQGILVGPDNGLLSGVLTQFPAEKVVVLNNPKYWRTKHVSSTFHGRDIFSPVGAYLANGVALEQIGDEISLEELTPFSFPDPEITDHYIRGYIHYIDYFGNLISNLSGEYVTGKQWWVEIHDQVIPSGNTYSDSSPNQLIALIGSHGWVEIAVNQGSAATVLSASYQTPMTVKFR